MLMKRSSRKQDVFGYRAQAMVEFAIALPILIMLLVGILEVGRIVFIYTAVTNASREAVRYASAIGLEDSGTYNKYEYCAGIKDMARRSAYFTPLTVNISYDNGPGTGSFDTCDGDADSVGISFGDRVNVTVTANYSPMVNLIPLGSRTITSSSARTILGLVELGSGSGPTNTPAATATVPAGTPTATVPADTPTATVPSETPTATDPSGPIITFTPLPTNTPTNTPTGTLQPTDTPANTPTATHTFAPTFTPTTTPTAMPGCDSITHGEIVISGNTMTMTITNPHDSITVLDVRVVWNYSTGGTNASTLNLQYASLGNLFWTGNSTTGDLTITPSTTVTIPGNNATSTLIFTFNKAYNNPGINDLLVINLSTPGCESFPIQSP